KAGVDGMTIHKAIQEFFANRGFPTEVRKGRRVGFFHGTGAWTRAGNSRASAFAKSDAEKSASAHGRARPLLSRPRRRATGGCRFGYEDGLQNPVPVSQAVGSLADLVGSARCADPTSQR